MASKNRQIELEVHNWLYHTKIKDVCGLKERFLFGLNELNGLVYEYLREKGEKQEHYNVWTKRDLFMRKIPEVQEMNQRLESEVIGLSLILRDAADRENVYNARFGMSVDLICKYFEEIALGSSFT